MPDTTDLTEQTMVETWAQYYWECPKCCEVQSINFESGETEQVCNCRDCREEFLVRKLSC